MSGLVRTGCPSQRRSPVILVSGWSSATRQGARRLALARRGRVTADDVASLQVLAGTDASSSSVRARAGVCSSLRGIADGPCRT